MTTTHGAALYNNVCGKKIIYREEAVVSLQLLMCFVKGLIATGIGLLKYLTTLIVSTFNYVSIL